MGTKVDYQETLQLPKTDFPMRANLAKREPVMLAEWEEKQYYQKLQEQAKELGLPDFILHDGPPYANGHIHIGTALNKVLKDIVIRSRSMEGHRVPYVPGWDTHGLPIELRAIKDLGVDREKVGPVEFREKCAEYARQYMGIQRDEFKRLGIWGEWDNPYLTLNKDYEAKQIEMFGKMASKGFIYKDLKPVYWCADCETALAEAEIEYADHKSPSIYVRFQVNDGKGKLDKDSYLVIWTTTPWTIPANLAICLHPQLTYVLVETEKGKLVVAKELLESFLEAVELPAHTVLQEFTGAELEGITCQHPLYERDSLVILGDHVTLEAGTGCVHTAPGHGLEDYVVGQKYKLPVFAPVDGKGRFTDEAGKYAGLSLDDGNKAVTTDLHELGALLKLEFIEHSYPHCWRCKDPVVFRATEQWFASLDGFREAMLSEIKKVQWIPGWGIDRITNMVADRGDWCISRQRIWGVPIPIFYCECGEAIVDEKVINHVASVFREEGSNAWFVKEASELLPEGFKCPHCQAEGGFSKETDIMDVWFDSGVSHGAVLEQHPELQWPADLYLEGSDQHRGWFQSSLSTAVAVYEQAPYKAVLTHGFVVDGDGRKMSKSLGNVIEPGKVMKKYGADILRMWVASTEYRGDIRISDDILKQLSEVYRRIRNTARFILGNIDDFDPKKHLVPYDDLNELDKWALARLSRLSQRVRNAFTSYDFHQMYHAVHNFCAVDLGGFYLDVQKDILYCDTKDSKRRRSAQSGMYLILNELVKLIAPVMVFTADEIWQYLPGREGDSVHLSYWEELPANWDSPELLGKWDRLLEVRKAVSRSLEQARTNKEIGSSNEAMVKLFADEKRLAQITAFEEELPMLFIVSKVQLGSLAEAPEKAADFSDNGGLKILVSKAPGAKCERCWKYHQDEKPELCDRCHTVVAER